MARLPRRAKVLPRLGTWMRYGLPNGSLALGGNSFVQKNHGDYTLEEHLIPSASNGFRNEIFMSSLLSSSMSCGPNPVELRHHRAPPAGR